MISIWGLRLDVINKKYSLDYSQKKRLEMQLATYTDQ